MLWSTVAMLPAVNTMIWKKSQQMALREEVLRVCAQTRISARFRSICKASLYCKMRLAAICIQTEIRRRIWMERRLSTPDVYMYEIMSWCSGWSRTDTGVSLT